jgi:GT2 family glycosyltransferase
LQYPIFRFYCQENMPIGFRMSTTNKVSATIITTCGDSVANAQEALTAIAACTDVEASNCLMLDNGASDAIGDYYRRIQASYPWLKVMQVAKGLEFTQACNLAAQEATGDLLVFLDAKARVSQGWLSAMTSIAERNPDAAVGAKIVDPEGNIQQAGGVVFRDGSVWNVGRGDDPNDPEYNYVREVDWCSEIALLVRRAAFLRVGGFDANLSGSGSAIDLGFSMRAAGFQVLYCGHSQIVHHDLIEPVDDWRPGVRRSAHGAFPELRKKWPVEMAAMPAPPTADAEARRLCDRRIRNGKQVLMAAEELPQFDRNAGAWTFYRFMTLLLEAGHHVTFVSRNTSWRRPNVDLKAYARKYEDIGAMVFGIDDAKESGRSLTPDAAFARLLQRRQYDAALLWTARDGRWFLERIQQLSPQTRTVINTGDLQLLREGRSIALNQGNLGSSGTLSEATAFGFAAKKTGAESRAQ